MTKLSLFPPAERVGGGHPRRGLGRENDSGRRGVGGEESGLTQVRDEDSWRWCHGGH